MNDRIIKPLRPVGTNLRKSRLKVDLTQEELARQVGITRYQCVYIALA